MEVAASGNKVAAVIADIEEWGLIFEERDRLLSLVLEGQAGRRPQTKMLDEWLSMVEYGIAASLSGKGGSVARKIGLMCSIYIGICDPILL